MPLGCVQGKLHIYTKYTILPHFLCKSQQQYYYHYYYYYYYYYWRTSPISSADKWKTWSMTFQFQSHNILKDVKSNFTFLIEHNTAQQEACTCSTGMWILMYTEMWRSSYEVVIRTSYLNTNWHETALFQVITQWAVVISYQCFGSTILRGKEYKNWHSHKVLWSSPVPNFILIHSICDSYSCLNPPKNCETSNRFIENILIQETMLYTHHSQKPHLD